jgi:hypothetical protein
MTSLKHMAKLTLAARRHAADVQRIEEEETREVFAGIMKELEKNKDFLSRITMRRGTKVMTIDFDKITTWLGSPAPNKIVIALGYPVEGDFKGDEKLMLQVVRSGSVYVTVEYDRTSPYKSEVVKRFAGSADPEEVLEVFFKELLRYVNLEGYADLEEPESQA